MHVEPSPVPPSPGSVLSSASGIAAARVAVGETLAPAILDSQPATRLPRQQDDVPEYRLVSAVELEFTAGDGRVGVRPGTRAFTEFQRLAAILLDGITDSRQERNS
ncbi:MAG: hypothetical protein CVT66_07295 [Actinobacteria bacterium HGW-Actinobacteria-6]|nr:MAG: hypothetical protein CVT66_07295 [Actinobacteria bacterium HGW-Actinobacteria-6]